MDFVTNILINIFLFLDKLIFKINGLLFDLFIEVAEGRFEGEFFSKLLNNLYVIIGIFIIFKVAFSLIQMLANPDLLTDKEKGAGKLTTRIVIAFGLIIMVPTIFDMAYSLQAAVLDDNIIGRLILGDIPKTDSNSNISQGSNISMIIFKGLIDVNVEDHDCAAAYESATKISDLTDANGTNCLTEKQNDEYVLDYKPLVSTITLGMVAWLMVGFCIDIGLRLVKLAFLQLLAPICIVTYIGGSKDNSFSKWTKMTISTYLGVFIKLIIIYFVVYVAGSLDLITGIGKGLGQVVVILGLLVFAKNATKLFGDLFGIKVDQESGFKGIAKTALLGGAAMAASGGLAGASNLAKGFGDTVKNVNEAGGNKGFFNALKSGAGWKALGAGAVGTGLSTIGGATSGAYHGARNGFGKNASLGGSVNKALMTSRTNRDNRDDRTKVYGGGVKGAWNNLVSDRIRGFAGLDTNAKKVVNQHKNKGAVLDRKLSNVHFMQNNVAQSLTHREREILDGYSYNAFDDKWTFQNPTTGDVTEFAANTTIDDILSTGTWSADQETYLRATYESEVLGKQIIENNKAMGKAETQQKKMEGSNGGNK